MGSDRSTGRQQAATDAADEATIKRVCTACHSFEEIVRSRREMADWHAVVTRMVGSGASATDDQVRMIRRYLVRHHGTIRVNVATAQEFSAVLGFSPKDAAAIVAYRRTYGPFASVDSFAKVNGIDRTRLNRQRQALRFN